MTLIVYDMYFEVANLRLGRSGQERTVVIGEPLPPTLKNSQGYSTNWRTIPNCP